MNINKIKEEWKMVSNFLINVKMINETQTATWQSEKILNFWLSILQQRDAELVEKIEKYFKENNHDEWNSGSLINLIKNNEL